MSGEWVPGSVGKKGETDTGRKWRGHRPSGMKKMGLWHSG